MIGHVVRRWGLGCLLLAVAPVWGADPVDPPDAASMRKLKSERTSLTGNVITPMMETGEVADREKLVRYAEIELLMMSAASNEALLPKMRESLRKNVFAKAAKAPNPGTHDELVRYFLTRLPDYIESDNVSPTARTNYVLVLGDLNQKEPLSSRSSSVPLPAALPKLIEQYQSHPLEACKAAALVGILRHASGNLPKERTAEVQDLMLSLLATKTVENRREEAQVWFRRRAAEILGAIGNPGRGNDNTAVLLALFEAGQDKENTLSLRIEATRAIGALSLSGVQNLNVASLGHLVGTLATEVTQHESSPVNIRYSLTVLDSVLQGSWVYKRGEDPKRSNNNLIKLAEGTAHEEYLKSLVENFQPLMDVVVKDPMEKDFATSIISAGEELSSWLEANRVEDNLVSN